MRGKATLVGCTLVGLVVAVPHSASAAMMTGQALQSQCQANAAFCGAYILGVVDRSGWLEAHLDQAKKCLPEGVRTGDLIGIAQDYLDAHPEALQLPAPDVIDSALKQALSC